MTQLGHVRWVGYSHQQLWDMIMPADPRAMLTRSDELATLAGAMAENATKVRTQLQKLMAGWSGASADQVAGLVGPVLDWSDQSASTASEIAARLGHYAEAVNTAREHMPAPVDYRALNAVADHQTAVVSNLPLNQPELTAMAQGHTATAAQAVAGKAKAVEVMRRFARDSASASHRMPTFHAPPALPGLVSPPPANPPGPVLPPPGGSPKPGAGHGHSPGPGPGDPSGVGSTTPASTVPSGAGLTTPSDFAGVAGGPGAGGVPAPGLLGAVGAGSGGLPGGGSGGLPGVAGSSAGLPGLAGVPGPASAAVNGAEAAAESQAARIAATEAAQGGGGGFAPMGQGGGRSGDRDGEHRDRYAGEPDLIGELPAAFPPVLG